ncbi:MAG: hypothetical protein ACYS1A_15985 [Planctomycetota bacterium]|jgi:hypothetical protein
MIQVILSSPILVEDGEFTRKTITQKEAQIWVNKNCPTNFSQHQITKILGVEPAATRENTPGYDEALIISPNDRLEFGREYTKAEIKEIGVSFVLIQKREAKNAQTK